MAVVRLSVQFTSDTRAIIAHLRQAAGDRVADRYAAELQRSVGQLVLTPGIGAPRGKLGKGVRMLIVSPYLIFYLGAPKAPEVLVLRLLDGRRRITRRTIARSRTAEPR
jgi:toxin ParE1/3/4